MRQSPENWYTGVFGGEKSIDNTSEIRGAPEVAATEDEVDNSKKDKHEGALIGFSHLL